MVNEQPESVFLVIPSSEHGSHSIQRAYSIREALELLVNLHGIAGTVSIEECHPSKGVRTVLEYAPESGVTGYQGWRPGYSRSTVLQWLSEAPGSAQ